VSSTAPAWVIDWLTAERHGKYLQAAGRGQGRALALYEWNARLAAALMHDLGHLEVGLRNAYDRALLSHPLVAGRDWLEPTVYGSLWPVHMVTDKTGGQQDKNAKPRSAIKAARKYAKYTEGGNVHRGKVVAELMFGFWTYLSDSLHEKSLWVPALHKAYGEGADRARLHQALGDLRDVRNRLAHNESIFDQNPENVRRRIIYVARNLSEPLRDHIDSNSDVAALLANKP
jgi:hypothetical protein